MTALAGGGRPEGCPAKDRLALLGLLAWAVVLFHEVAFSGRVFFERDIQLQWCAQARAFVRSIRAGSWPLWDPVSSFGAPLWANPNNEVLYPPTWLLLGLEPGAYYALLSGAHVLLAGAGVYALSRRLGTSPRGSFLGAACFMASGPLLSAVNLWNHLAGIAWLPWVLWTADRALASERMAPALACGAALGLQVLTGSPDAVALTLVTLLPFALLRAPRGALRRSVRLVGLAGAFGLALSAGQWLPTLDMLRGSARWAMPAAERTFWSLPPAMAPGALVPFFRLLSGEFPLRPEIRAVVAESREPLLRSIYLGLPGLVFVGAALAGRRPRLAAFWGVVALGATLLAMGRHVPVVGALVHSLPPLSVLRFPVKAMLLAALAWSLLVGGGFDAWREGVAFGGRSRLALALLAAGALGAASLALLLTRPGALAALASQPSGRAEGIFAATLVHMLVACGALLGAALLAWLRPSSRPRAALLAGSLVLSDLLLNHHDLNPTSPSALLEYRPQALEGLGPASRLYVYDYLVGTTSLKHLERESPYIAVRFPPGLSLPETEALALRNYAYPPVAGQWDIPGSYVRDLLYLLPTDLDRLTALLIRLEGTPQHLRMLQMGAVTHVVALHEAGFEGLVPLQVVPSFTPEPIRVYGVPDPLPRAYAAGRVLFAEGGAALSEVARGDFDPHVETVLSGRGGAGPGASGTVRVAASAPDRVRLEADLGRGGYVVLVDTYDPGWRATVDGRETAVLKANVAFRAVYVPAGRHVVDFRYRPASWALGLALSLAGLLAGCALAAGEALARRPPLSRGDPRG